MTPTQWHAHRWHSFLDIPWPPPIIFASKQLLFGLNVVPGEGGVTNFLSSFPGKEFRKAFKSRLSGAWCWEMLEHGQKTLMIQTCFAIQSLVNYNQSYLPNIRSPWAGPQNWTSGSNIILNNGFVWGVRTIASDYIRWKKLQCLNADDPWLFQESWSHLGANELKLKSRSSTNTVGS